jgi:hypothetical protein
MHEIVDSHTSVLKMIFGGRGAHGVIFGEFDSDGEHPTFVGVVDEAVSSRSGSVRANVLVLSSSSIC